MARGAVSAIRVLLRMVVERQSVRVRLRADGVIYALLVLHDLWSFAVAVGAVRRSSARDREFLIRAGQTASSVAGY